MASFSQQSSNMAAAVKTKGSGSSHSSAKIRLYTVAATWMCDSCWSSLAIGSISLGASYRIFVLGKRLVAHVSAHPPIFAAELQAPMGAYPEEYDITYTGSTGTCTEKGDQSIWPQSKTIRSWASYMYIFLPYINIDFTYRYVNTHGRNQSTTFHTQTLLCPLIRINGCA